VYAVPIVNPDSGVGQLTQGTPTVCTGG